MTELGSSQLLAANRPLDSTSTNHSRAMHTGIISSRIDDPLSHHNTRQSKVASDAFQILITDKPANTKTRQIQTDKIT